MASFEDMARSAITSALDITNKLTTAKSNDTFPHINDDVPLGNFNAADEFSVKVNFTLFRVAQGMGAKKACLMFLADADETINVSRGRFGFQNRILRSSISQASTSVRDESAGFNFFKPQNKEY